jgi:hypothetical protein
LIVKTTCEREYASLQELEARYVYE